MATLLSLNINTLSLDVYTAGEVVTLELFIDRANAIDLYYTFEDVESFHYSKHDLLKVLDSKLDTYRSVVREAILSI